MKQILKRLRILRSFATYISFATATVYATSPEMQLIIVSQPTDISIVQKGEIATISFVAEKGDYDVSYQWYQSTDGTKQTGVIIDGATSNSFTTEVFTVKGIRYYYCIATSGDESVASDVVVAAYTGLPTLRINTETPIDSITKEEYVLGTMEIIYGNGEIFSYEFKKEKNGEKKEGIKGRGNSSWQQPKKGYSIKFESKQSLFGFPASKKWCITGNHSDKTLLRNKLASILGYEIYNTVWNPRFVSVDLVWNGEYRGNYVFGEKIAIGSGRVDIQDISDYSEKNIEFERYTDQNGDGSINLYDGGFIFEIDQRDEAEFMFITTKEAHIALDDPDSISEETWSHIKNVIQTAEDVLYSTNYTNELEGWRNFYDEKSIIDWFFVNEIAKNRDARQYASIYKYYSPIEKKIHFAPIWDFDIGFGNDGEKGDKPQYGTPTGWYIKNGTWMGRFFTDSGFVANIKSRWNSKKIALINTVTNNLQMLANENATSAECNFNKWKILGKYVWPNPEGYKDRQTYQSEIDYLKNWLGERIAWMDIALKNSFFISYDLAGGTLAKKPTKVFLSQSTSDFTLKNPSRYGYTFAGWSGPGIDGLSTSVKVTDDGKGDRTFTANWTRDFSIKDISLCSITLSDSGFIYNGSTITPAIVVTDDGKTLIANEDYTTNYENNVAAGIAKIIVSGIGEYSGKQEKLFTIAPRPVVVKIENEKKMYGMNDPEWNWTIEGLLSCDNVGDVLNGISVFREPLENVGRYTISVNIDSIENSNYTADVKEGILTIEPDTTKVVVKVVGHIDTVEYDGKKHAVYGFDIKSNNEKYSPNFIDYAGDSLVIGKDAKTYPMGLATYDFKNISENFSNVLFDITDGYLVIKPQEKNQAFTMSPENGTPLRLSSTGRYIRVQTTLLSKRYAVYDIQGVVVQIGNVEQESFDISVKKAGVFIVHIGSTMQKVYVR